MELALHLLAHHSLPLQWVILDEDTLKPSMRRIFATQCLLEPFVRLKHPYLTYLHDQTQAEVAR